jgi:hypothetical protein
VAEPAIYREGVTAALLALHDMKEDVAVIVEILLEEDDGEEDPDT